MYAWMGLPWGVVCHCSSTLKNNWWLCLLIGMRKLGLWSCQPWYQHPSWVLTLLPKLDSGLLLDIFQYCCRKQKQGERGDVSPLHLIAQHQTGIMILSTVVPTSFAGVDSFDKTRSRFIVGHLPILLWETETHHFCAKFSNCYHNDKQVDCPMCTSMMHLLSFLFKCLGIFNQMILMLVQVMAAPYHTSGNLASCIFLPFVPLFMSTSTKHSMATKSFHIKALEHLLSTYHHPIPLFVWENLHTTHLAIYLCILPSHFVPLFLSASTKHSMARKSFHIKTLEHLLSTYHHANPIFVWETLDQIIDCNLDDDVFDKNNDWFLLVPYLHQRICQIHQSWYLR